ncbi:MAG: hypothetical protein ABI478_02020 [Propionivibrio sp.]
MLRPQIHWQPVRVEPGERGAWLQAWADRLTHIEAEVAIEVSRY